MSNICEFHTVFLRNLFVLYLSIDEKITIEGNKIIFAKFLEFFHDDLFPENYSNFESCLENPHNYEVAFNMFARDCSQMVERANTDSFFRHIFPVYFTVSQVRSALNLIVKDLELTILLERRKFQPWVKSKKLLFE